MPDSSAAAVFWQRTRSCCGPRRWSNSDHGAFLDQGISALDIGRGPDSRNHTPDDRVEYVEPDNLAIAGRLVLALLEQLAAEAAR